eukprot:TCONS_00068228-protein
MSNIPKSMFIPPSAKLGKDDLSISLGDFHSDHYDQGFDGSGKYYFILMDEMKDNGVTVFVINFNETSNSIDKKQLKISIPVTFECKRSSFLFPYHGVIIHSLKRNEDGGKKLVADLYFINICDLLRRFESSNQTMMVDKKPDISLKYEKRH